MTRNCTACKTPIRSHVLVINEKDWHRKSCYCRMMHDRPQKKGLCSDCEPLAPGSEKKPDKTGTRTRTGRKPRSVMIVS